MTAMNHLFCKASLPTDSDPKSLLQFCTDSSLESFFFLPLTVEKHHHLVNSLQILLQHIPMSTRGTNLARSWD